MQVLITNIKIPDRVRMDVGDLDPLMESLKRCGQLNPITLSREMELIAGFRRLSAAQRLGWKMIDATVVDGLTALRRLEMELEENVYRKDFTPDELLEGVKRLEALRHPKLRTRVKQAFKRMFGKLAFWKRRPSQTEVQVTAIAPPPVDYSPAASDDDAGAYGV